jgi:hypothetical protein
MYKIPAPPHPVTQLTATELETYIGQLRTARQQIKTTDVQNTLLIRRLGEAYAALNELSSDIRPEITLTEDEQTALKSVPDSAA